MTPAMFMVRALVLPMSMNTLMFSPKAAAALLRKMGMSKFTCMHARCLHAALPTPTFWPWCATSSPGFVPHRLSLQGDDTCGGTGLRCKN